MKNNKGFTLIELLAVIAIMAILAIAAITGYNTMANNSKKKAYDSKVQEIEDAAVKFAKETNLQNGTTISVNSLVVQGFLQPDVATDSGLAQVTNPKNQDNMICNLVTITIEDDIYVAKYSPDKKDCKVAEQELDNTEIIVTEHVLTGNDIGDNIPFVGNVADWTKEDVVLVVDSEEYTDFVSVSYDYDGQTITKPKNIITSKDEYYEADYNKLAIRDIQVMFNSEVTITYNMSDGSTHSKTVIVRIDREVPTMRSVVDNDVTIGSTKKVNLYLDDANGSGVVGFYVSKDKNFPVGTPFISDDSNKDNIGAGSGSFAGYNSHFYGDQSTYYVKVVDKVGNEYISSPIGVSNFETATKTCRFQVKDTFENTLGDSIVWFNKAIKLIATTDQAMGTMGVKYLMGTLSSPPNNEKQLTKFFNGQTNGGILTDFINLNSEVDLKNYYMAMQGLEKDKNINYCEKQVGVDWTKPTVSISCVDNDCNTYKQTHKIKITITDDRSGFYIDGNSIKIGWSTSNTVPPSGWETLTGGTIKNYKNASNKTITDGQMEFVTEKNKYSGGNPISGDYYLWVLGTSVKDKAQNSPIDTKSSMVIKYDNTPPTCINSGGSASWVRTNVTIVGNCTDAHSGCKKGTNGTNYTYDAKGNVSKIYNRDIDSDKESPGTVYDNAGNSTICPWNVTVKRDATAPTITDLKYNYRNSIYADSTGNKNCQLQPSDKDKCKFSWNWSNNYYELTSGTRNSCREQIKANIEGTCTPSYNSGTIKHTAAVNAIDSLYSNNNEGAEIYVDSVTADDNMSGLVGGKASIYIGDYQMGQGDSKQNATTTYNLKSTRVTNGNHPGYVFKIVAKDNAGNETTWKVYAVVLGAVDVSIKAPGCKGYFCVLNKHIKYPVTKSGDPDKTYTTLRNWSTGWVFRHYIRTSFIGSDKTVVDWYYFWTYYSDGTHKATYKNKDMCNGGIGCQLHGWYSIGGTNYWFNTNEIAPGYMPDGGMLYSFPGGDIFPDGYGEDWEVCDDSAAYYSRDGCSDNDKSILKCNKEGACWKS